MTAHGEPISDEDRALLAFVHANGWAIMATLNAGWHYALGTPHEEMADALYDGYADVWNTAYAATLPTTLI